MPPRGYALLISVILGWGLAWPMIKIGLNEVPPLAYRGLMLPVAGLLTLLIARFMGERVRLPNGQWAPFLFSTLLNITCWVFFSTVGLHLMGSGHASIIAYTMPLWAMLCAVLFTGDRPTGLRYAGLACGLVGLGILLSGELGAMADSPLGVFLMLMAAATWASIFVLIVPTIFCWFAWFRVVALAPVVVSTVGIMLVPVMAVIGGGLILDEAVGVREIAALAFVVLGIALVLMPQKSKPA